MDTDQDLNFIDSYLEGTLTKEQEAEFENRLTEDKEFNKTYQFILSIREASTIADEVQRIKEMLRAEPLEKSNNDTIEGKVINFKPSIENSYEDQREENVQTKSINLWPYLKYAGIAASITIIFLVWQPTKDSNDEIFASYTSGNLDVPLMATLDSKSYSKNYELESTINQREDITQGVLRGGESKPEHYTYDEWQEVLRAIEMLHNREYSKAKKVFNSTLKPNEKNSQLLIYYAISQLHSNEVEKAIFTLEQLKKSTNTNRDVINFHLAIGYIKIGKVRDARALLRKVKHNAGILSDQASTVLNNMRWF